jgi:hypothetical protein
MKLLSRALFGALALLCAPLPASATGILPLSGQQQFDNATAGFLNAGCMWIFATGTTTPRTVYTDFALTVPHPSPIVLNSVGRVPPIYGADGAVRVRVRSKNTDGSAGCLVSGVLQFDQDNVALVTAAASGSSLPIPDATQIWGTGDIKVRYDDQPVEGYVRLNGRTIGSATSGAAERANADAEALFKFLWGFSNVSVVTGKGASAAADWAANKQLTLPDMAGRLLGARDDLGNGAAGRITAATVTGPTAVGAAGGTEKGTIAQANLPNVNFPVSGITLSDTRTWGWSKPGSNAGVTGATDAILQPSGTNTTITDTVTVTGGELAVATQGTAASGGAGTAFNTIAPVMLFTTYIKL